MRKNLSAVLYGLCALVVIASFMPWRTLGNSMSTDIDTGKLIYLDWQTGWQGVTFFSFIGMPNCAILLTAALIAWLTWRVANGQGNIRPQVPLLLAVYGLIHTLLFLKDTYSFGAVFGLGSIIALVSFAAILYVMIKGPKSKVSNTS